MKHVKEDTAELLRTARKRWSEAKRAEYVGYDEKNGHEWIIRGQAGDHIARGWFGADGDPHFREFK